MPILKNFPIQKQLTPFSCGYSTIASIYSFLEKTIGEKEVSDKSDFRIINIVLGKFFSSIEVRGIPSFYFAHLFNKLSLKYKMETMHIKKKQGLMNLIESQIQKRLPVPFLYSAMNEFGTNKKMVIHYSTIIGLENKERVIISDPFGYIRKLDTAIFLNKLSFLDYKNMPLTIKLLIFLKIIRKNTIFILKNKNAS